MSHENGNGTPERIATIGGTFDTLHAGHKAYIQLAFDHSDYVIIYLNSDEYAAEHKKYPVRSYDSRIEKLKEFIQEIGCEHRCKFRLLRNFEELKRDYLEGELKEKICLAVVIPEYYELFMEINNGREARGLKSILLLVKPRKYNSTNCDISSHELRNRFSYPISYFESISEM